MQIEQLARKFVMTFGLKPTKRRRIVEIDRRLDHRTRATFRAALARDIRDGNKTTSPTPGAAQATQTHVGRFLAAQGL